METNQLILLEQFCASHGIEMAFIQTLEEFGLVNLQTVENKHYLAENELSNTEKFLRLHFDLNINVEGIDVVASLLQRIEQLQLELTAAKNRLRLFE
jgi:hypothetical protein